ncbi:carbonate dehydratase [Cellulomonas xylanilytica]|uniref:Cation-transporting P-type ATPase B n=2 Tax=Cellulomonas xylanilytica TaxID=233583 RepID=A0A510V509_9CELL|nr:heavy metal translocating P-type ATPase [Cellulomonas xylanilytica]GEK21958.1 carbonate dehydratase [Cellulomonas xylanilytica]
MSHDLDQRTVDLAIEGMTCASCVARVEKKLNRLPGVEATVNLPLESARVTVDGPVDADALVAAVRSAGYDATVVGAPKQAAPEQTQHMHHEGMDPFEHALSGHSMAPGHDMDPDEDTSAPTDARGTELRSRLRVASVLTVPVLLLSMIPALQFTGWQWVVAALALPVVTWAAWPFHRAAFRAARHGASTMDTLVSIGVIAATAWSLWALLLGGAGELGLTMTPTLWPRAEDAAMGMEVPELYFEVAAVVTTFLLAGRYAEHRSRRRAGDALRTLLDLGAKDVALLVDGTERRVPVDRLTVGDEFVVRPGEKVATDGVVVSGTSALDTSLLTGEPVPVDVGPGDDVTGATINTSGALVVRATRVGADTRLAQIGRLVATAQTGKAAVQRLADRISAVFVPIVLVLALGTLVVWLATGSGAQAAFTAAVAVLIIACPCALGLATPTALLVGTGRGAQRGILIKGPEILEQTRTIDTVVLDKTGTVTEGRMALVDTIGEPDVLRYAAAVEQLAEHPIGRAIAAAVAEQDGPTGADGVVIGADQVHDFRAEAGHGVSGVVRTAHSGVGLGRRVLVGKPAWLREQGIDPAAFQAAVDAAEADGATAVMVAWDGAPRGVLVLRDPVKPTSAQAVAELRALGLRPVLLTGDNAGAARAAAREVGIDEDDVVAHVLPADKVAVVERLQREGARVAMVGDGVNDAAALATADLGLAMGTGTDVAIEASDITLVRGDLRSAGDAIRLSRRTLRVIKQNLFWAFAYNVAAIPLAALGLLNPMIAGAAMALSSVLVVGNSLRLRRFE